MKKIYNIFKTALCMTFVGILITYYACDKDELDYQTSNTDTQLIEKLNSLGFLTDEIEETEHHIILDGDIRLNKEYISNIRLNLKNDTNSRLKQFYAGDDFLVSYDNRKIYVYLDLSDFNILNFDYVLNDAIILYNNLDSYLKFVRTYSNNSNVDLRIDGGIGEHYGDCAEADFPLYGNVGEQIVIDENVITGYGIYMYDKLLFLLIHEIGHCIGLRHTNWHTYPGRECKDCPHPNNNELTMSAIQVPGTPSTDFASVFNKGTCGYIWDDFSYYDKKAIEFLYAIPPPPVTVNISGPGRVNCESCGTWTANAAYGTGNYSYSWSYKITKRYYPDYNGTSSNNPLTICFGEDDLGVELEVVVTSGDEQAYDNHVAVHYCE